MSESKTPAINADSMKELFYSLCHLESRDARLFRDVLKDWGLSPEMEGEHTGDLENKLFSLLEHVVHTAHRYHSAHVITLNKQVSAGIQELSHIGKWTSLNRIREHARDELLACLEQEDKGITTPMHESVTMDKQWDNLINDQKARLLVLLPLVENNGFKPIKEMLDDYRDASKEWAADNVEVADSIIHNVEDIMPLLNIKEDKSHG